MGESNILNKLISLLQKMQKMYLILLIIYLTKIKKININLEDEIIEKTNKINHGNRFIFNIQTKYIHPFNI